MDRANGAGSGAAASRAERFEDEKRRIIESCFSKKDQDGSSKLALLPYQHGADDNAFSVALFPR